MHDPTTGLPEDSDSTLMLQNADPAEAEGNPAATLIGYTWVYQGAPQQGTLLLNIPSAEPRAQWMDTWHTGGEPMLFAAEADGETALALLGSYPAPPGPDWGWRIVLETGGETLQVRMDNITSDGEETVCRRSHVPARLKAAK